MENLVVESLTEVNFSNLGIPAAVVYERPTDFPNMYVARIWDASIGKPTNIAITRMTLEEIREDIEAAGFLAKYPATRKDDQVLVETWIK